MALPFYAYVILYIPLRYVRGDPAEESGVLHAGDVALGHHIQDVGDKEVTLAVA